jgi:hypothetical protein
MSGLTTRNTPVIGRSNPPRPLGSITVQDAVRNMDPISSLYWRASRPPEVKDCITIRPGWCFLRTANIFSRCLGLTVLSAIRCRSSSKERSAFAALSCCFAVASWRTVSWLERVRLSFVSCSTPCFASSIRALASACIASCTLLPEFQTRYVPRTVSTRISTYAPNIRLCRVCAAFISSPLDGWFVVAVLVALGVTVVMVAGLAIITSHKRTTAIIRKYCNTQGSVPIWSTICSRVVSPLQGSHEFVMRTQRFRAGLISGAPTALKE